MDNNYKSYNDRIAEITKELSEIFDKLRRKNDGWLKESLLSGEKARAIASGNVFWLEKVQEKLRELKKSKSDVKELKQRQAELRAELSKLQKHGPTDPNFIDAILDDAPDPDLPKPADFSLPEEKEVTADV